MSRKGKSTQSEDRLVFPGEWGRARGWEDDKDPGHRQGLWQGLTVNGYGDVFGRVMDYSRTRLQQ